MAGRFIDEYAPSNMPSHPCISSPRFSSQIVMVDSGDENVNQRWEHPLYRFTMPECIREHATYAAVRDQWLAMRGPVHTWPFRDPLDFASVELEFPNIAPAIAGTDQLIGIGDGVTYQYQLTKEYSRGVQTYVRNIYLPVVSTLLVAVEGMLTNNYSVTRPGGVISLDVVPDPSFEVRAGFLFDVEVRFENDESFDGIVQKYAIGGYADLTLLEVRRCTDGE